MEDKEILKLASDHTDWLLGLILGIKGERLTSEDTRKLMVEEFIRGYKHGYELASKKCCSVYDERSPSGT